jgi:hypothetical protein
MSRTRWLLVVGSTLVIVVFFALTPLLEAIFGAGPDFSPQREATSFQVEERAPSSALAPVLTCDTPRPNRGKPGKYYRDFFGPRDATNEIKVAEIEVRTGQAFINDELVPRAALTEYLNRRVATKDVEIVILFGEEGGKWGDVVSIIDQCRKSRVSAVYVSHWAL